MVKKTKWSLITMAKLHLRTDPLTLYMLLLAAYGLGMTLTSMQKHKATVEAAVMATRVGGIEQGEREARMETVSRKRRSPSRDNLWWLEGAADLLGRLAVPETRCRKLMARQGENCGSPGVLGCLDEDVAPRTNSCDVYSVSDHQREQSPIPSDLFFGCKLINVAFGDDSPPGLISEAVEMDRNVGEAQTSRFLQVRGGTLQGTVLPRLVSSGLLQGMKQLLIEVHVAMGDGSEKDAGNSEGQVAPALRDHWRVLEVLSSLGFRRAHFLPNPSSSIFHSIPPVNKNLKNIPISDPSLDASYYIQPDIYRTPPEANLAPSTFDGALLKRPDLSHEPDSDEPETVDFMSDEHLICGVLLYVYRPDVPLPVPPAPYQDKAWRSNYDPQVTTHSTLVHYNASLMEVPKISTPQEEILLV